MRAEHHVAGSDALDDGEYPLVVGGAALRLAAGDLAHGGVEPGGGALGVDMPLTHPGAEVADLKRVVHVVEDEAVALRENGEVDLVVATHRAEHGAGL